MVTMFYLKPRSCLVWALMAWALSATAQTQANTTMHGRDFIVSIVDSVPITNHDVTLRAQQLREQLKQQNRPVPEGADLLRAALERLIVEKALLQHAKETGLTIDDEAITQAEQRLAAQSQLTVEALHAKIKGEGSSVERLRQNLREQITLQRLTERNVPSRIKVSDVEVDQAVRERQNATLSTNPDIELGHVLIAVPEKATEAEVATLQSKAQTVVAKLKRGDDLARVAKEFSDGTERDKGGLMGLRAANRYPTLFMDATKNLNVGDVTLLFRGRVPCSETRHQTRQQRAHRHPNPSSPHLVAPRWPTEPNHSAGAIGRIQTPNRSG